MTILIPDSFRNAMHTIHGYKKAEDWFQRLPTILDECARRWHLTILPPVPNLSFHYVAPAIHADGTPVILKANSPTSDFAREAEAMRVLGEGGRMARVLEVDYAHEVLLLERLLPGNTLAELVPEEDERATSILVEVMRSLWRPAPDGHGFKTVEGYGQGFARLRERFGPDCGPFPRHLVEPAERLFVELNSSAPQHFLLHGDLHHENVLRAGDGWKAIDAQGVVGDPGYEVGLLFYNPLGLLHKALNPRQFLARRLDQLTTELSMERERIRGWGLAQCMLSCWWNVEDGAKFVPTDELECAQIMAEL